MYKFEIYIIDFKNLLAKASLRSSETLKDELLAINYNYKLIFKLRVNLEILSN